MVISGYGGRPARMDRQRVVIVGGGFAGLRAAKALGNAGFPTVTLLDRHNHHVFQPMLYQVATAALDPSQIARPIRSILTRYRNITVLETDVTGIDVGRRTVTANQLQFEYDYLVLAAGAENNYFDHAEWRAQAPGLKTVRDAVTIRNRLLEAFEAAERETDAARRQQLLTFVIVGGGYTGVELAGAVAELAYYTLARDFRRLDPGQLHVVLVEAGPSIMPSLPAELGHYARGVLASLNVEVLAGTRVSAITPEGIVSDSRQIRSAIVLWAAGTRASPLGSQLDATRDAQGRVCVNPDLSLPGHPEVFVAGDMACYRGADGTALAAIAPVAFQQGFHIARNICADMKGRARHPFRYWNKGELAAIGRNRAVGLVGRWQIRGRFAWLIWVFVHIYYLTDFRNRLIVLLQWAWTYLADSRGARVIIEADRDGADG